MKQYYLIISGEYPDLARAESEALLKILDASSTIDWYGRVGVAELSNNPTDFLLKRAAFLRECGEVVVRIHRVSDIMSEDLGNFLTPGTTFYVRSFIAEQPRTSGQSLSAEVGRILKNTTQARVSFERPQVRIRAIDLGGDIIIGILNESPLRSELGERKGNNRAFFHPSMMRSHLARAMCNLARVMPGDIMLDPFCGGGGILCEGAQLGARTVGIDMSWRLLQGARKNLQQIGSKTSALVQGDSRLLPINQVDVVVTDPPYGRTSSTRGGQPIRIVSQLLDELSTIIRNGGRLCICSKKEMNVGRLIQERGLTEEVSVKVRIHKMMTREIRVVVY